MSALHFFVVLAVLGSTLAFAGEFVPKSFYTIDEDGHKSDVVYLRKSALPRFRRSARPSDGAGSFSGSAAFGGPSSLPDIAGAVESGLSGTFQQLRSLQAQVEQAGGGGGAGGGGHAYSGSFSTSGGGPGQGGVLHSRFASSGGGSEKEYVTGGNGGIQASASAQGPRGAFSSSSSSVDSDGRVHYNVNARKF